MQIKTYGSHKQGQQDRVSEFMTALCRGVALPSTVLPKLENGVGQNLSCSLQPCVTIRYEFQMETFPPPPPDTHYFDEDAGCISFINGSAVPLTCQLTSGLFASIHSLLHCGVLQECLLKMEICFHHFLLCIPSVVPCDLQIEAQVSSHGCSYLEPCLPLQLQVSPCSAVTVLNALSPKPLHLHAFAFAHFGPTDIHLHILCLDPLRPSFLYFLSQR